MLPLGWRFPVNESDRWGVSGRPYGIAPPSASCCVRGDAATAWNSRPEKDGSRKEGWKGGGGDYFPPLLWKMAGFFLRNRIMTDSFFFGNMGLYLCMRNIWEFSGCVSKRMWRRRAANSGSIGPPSVSEGHDIMIMIWDGMRSWYHDIRIISPTPWEMVSFLAGTMTDSFFDEDMGVNGGCVSKRMGRRRAARIPVALLRIRAGAIKRLH